MKKDHFEQKFLIWSPVPFRDQKLLTIFAKRFMLEVLQGFECAPKLHVKTASTINGNNVVKSHIPKLKDCATSPKTENC